MVRPVSFVSRFALFLRARLGQDSAPIQEAFLQLASITVADRLCGSRSFKELRVAFYYLLLSFLGAIGLGLAMASNVQALSGVLLFWFSGSLAVAGFGMTIEIFSNRASDDSTFNMPTASYVTAGRGR